ncbi:MAG: dTDP-4-dehydrorhamnose 3,5-epimerase [Planctomycetes bacterium]|nr:dTDP-4-dehydrorhamnose 3,5-epimerase [Planctomycetota bacterium]MCB9918140.1 dTDP-4-dehydrorhamnose 3,5-epimerase [Planctomycetota bacterium]
MTEFVHTELPGVLRIKPRVFGDARGFFVETWQRERYAHAGIDLAFVQDNHSRSKHGTLRGLHLNCEKPQGKLVRCVEGEIFDVAVDVRRGSPHYRQWVGVTLSADNFEQIWVPPGFAHGFLVLSDIAQVEYKVTDVYWPQGDLNLRWDDPDLGIDWPLDRLTGTPLLSDQDAGAASLRDLEPRLLHFH